MDQAEVRPVDQVVEVFKEEVVEEDPLLVVQVVEAQAVVVHLEDQEVQAQEDQVDQGDQVDRCLKTLMQLLLEFTLQVLGYSMHSMVITSMLSNKKLDLLIYASPMLHLSDNSIITLGHHV